MTQPDKNDSELLGKAGVDKRNARALVVAELLRLGHTAQGVSAALKVTDAGGSVYDAMEALRAADEAAR